MIATAPIVLDPLELTVGACFVFFHSFIRFNRRPAQPTPAWASTTKIRYVSGAIAYASVIILVFVIITHIPGILPDSLTSTWPAAFQRPPLLAALLLTVLLPQIGILKNWDAGIRDFFHRRASIPSAMRRLSAELQTGRTYEVPPQMKAQVQEYLVSKDFRDTDVRFEDGGKLRNLFTRITVLFLQVDKWPGDDVFSSFVTDNEGEHKLLQSRYAALRTDIRTVLRMRKPKTGSSAEKWLNEVLDDTKHFLADLCDFISRAVLQSGWRQQTREAQLRRLGFDLPQPSPPNVVSMDFWNVLISLLGSLLLLMFIMFVFIFRIFHPSSSNPYLKQVLVLTVLVAVMQFVAVMAATIPRRWMVFSRKKSEGPPVALIYMIIAFSTAFAGTLLSLAAQLLIEPRPWNFPKLLGMAIAWSLLGSATTLATAYNIDHQRPPGVEGLINMVSLSIAMFIVCVLTGANDATQFIERFAVAGVVGFLIGIWIPRRYREESGLLEPAPIPSLTVPTAQPPAAAPAVPGTTPTPPQTAPQQPPQNLRPLFINWDQGDDFAEINADDGAQT